ncbi:MAG: zinc ribbon domain-containing protein [Candidatus Bathyarchaeota archaeon]|nr:zinc ribbon domain-containing protein [Candidatus Bathyarchaeota archaeon]
MPYCPNCGAETQPGSKFCSNCGTPLQAAPAQAPVPAPRPVATGEQIFASMSGLSKGLLGREYYVLLMTPQTLLFVKLSGEDRKQIGQEMTAHAKDEGVGLFGRIATSLSASSNMGDYFIGWTPQQVSARFNDVFSVSVMSVREIRVRSMDTTDYDRKYELRVKATGFNEKFRLSRHEKDEHQALKQLFGGKYKSNTWFF